MQTERLPQRPLVEQAPTSVGPASHLKQKPRLEPFLKSRRSRRQKTRAGSAVTLISYAALQELEEDEQKTSHHSEP